MDIEGFDRFLFPSEGLEKPVYRRGTGPAVLLIHELPGMSEPCIAMGRRLADAAIPSTCRCSSASRAACTA
jgi:hypothetical protein